MQGTLLTESSRTLAVAERLAAEELAAELRTSRPATRILADFGGHALRLDILPGTDGGHCQPGTRRLTAEEKGRLNAPGLAQCCCRSGFLRYGVHGIAAAVTLMWLPARLPAEACWQLAHTTRPAGLILERWGLVRTDQSVMVLSDHDDGERSEPPVAVRSSAVLVVGGWPAGIATEDITREFVAARRASPLPSRD